MDDGYRDSDEPVGLPRDGQGSDASYGQDPIEDVAGSGRLFWQRLVGVLKCSPAAFVAFAGDRRATWQIAALVVVTSAINHIGNNLSGRYSDLAAVEWGSEILAYDVLFVPLGVVCIAVWAGIVTLVSRLFSIRSVPYGEWFRSLGAISVANVLYLIPFAGWALSTLYWIVLLFVAVRTVARVSKMAAIGIIAISWFGPAVVVMLLVGLFIVIAIVLA